MRAARYLLAAVTMLGAVSAASAQSHALISATLDQTEQRLPPRAAVHVSNLIDDPDWREQWGNAFYIQVHWKVQLWKERFLVNGQMPALEWDVCVQQVPGLDLFNYAERVGGRRSTTTFRTLDSLRAHLLKPVGPPQRPLASGSWFYLIDAHVSTSPEDPCDPQTATARAGFLERLVQGAGPTRDLSQVRLDFKVP